MAKTEEIKLLVELDNEKLVERMFWETTDGPASGSPQETKAFALSVFDHETGEIMKIDLWSKDMDVNDMKFFMIQTVASLADTLLDATGDEEMHTEMMHCAERMALLHKRQQSGN